MNSPTRFGIVLLAFGAITLLIPLVDESPDAATTPIGGALLIAGVLLLLVGVLRRPA